MKLEQLQDELEEAMRSRRLQSLRRLLDGLTPPEIASLISDAPPDGQVLLFRCLPRRTAMPAFKYLPRDKQHGLLKALAREEVAGILNEMADDERTMLLEELPGAATKELLTLLSEDERAIALKLLGYPEGSVGRLMTPHYVAVLPTWAVRQVLDHVREHGKDSETLTMVYVVDERGLLIDDIRMRSFLLAPLHAHVYDLMDNRFTALKASDTQEAAVRVFRDADLPALPVTDTDGMLIGVVTADDVLNVAEARATREIQKIGGSEALDEPYMQIPFTRMVRKRAGWLAVLALFVPLVISSGGTSGSQAATLVIRALALGEVGLRQWWQVMRREILSGLALGAILGSIGFLRITLWSMFSDIYGPHWLLVALTVGVSLVGIVLWGTLSGSMLPFILRRLGFDPATSSAPFVATLVDVTGLVNYFSVGMLIMRGTLL